MSTGPGCFCRHRECSPHLHEFFTGKRQCHPHEHVTVVLQVTEPVGAPETEAGRALWNNYVAKGNLVPAGDWYSREVVHAAILAIEAEARAEAPRLTVEALARFMCARGHGEEAFDLTLPVNRDYWRGEAVRFFGLAPDAPVDARLTALEAEFDEFYEFVNRADPAIVDAYLFVENNRRGHYDPPLSAPVQRGPPMTEPQPPREPETTCHHFVIETFWRDHAAVAWACSNCRLRFMPEANGQESLSRAIARAASAPVDVPMEAMAQALDLDDPWEVTMRIAADVIATLGVLGWSLARAAQPDGLTVERLAIGLHRVEHGMSGIDACVAPGLHLSHASAILAALAEPTA